jgi:putative transposase
MNKHELLLHGNYYHIFNRGINSCNLFRDPDNYEYFLELYDKHITPIAETYAWVFMPNHFHLLVRIREKDEIGTMKRSMKPINPEKSPHQYFSNLFNAYTKAVNKCNQRTGSLFEHPYKRKIITDKEYFRRMIIYIHNNPVHHGFTEKAMDYPWSSYLTCLSLTRTKIKQNKVLGWFDSMANFRLQHKTELEYPDDLVIFEPRPSRLVQP